MGFANVALGFWSDFVCIWCVYKRLMVRWFGMHLVVCPVYSSLFTGFPGRPRPINILPPIDSVSLCNPLCPIGFQNALFAFFCSFFVCTLTHSFVRRLLCRVIATAVAMRHLLTQADAVCPNSSVFD